MISISEAARDAPRAVALCAGDRTLGYAELADLAATRHVPPGELVAVRGENRVETVALLLGLLDAGRAFLPVHPRAPDAEVARLVAQLGATELLDGAAGRGATPRAVAPDQLACVLATSGTTGTPKGAELTFGALRAAERASLRNLGFCGDDRWILCLPVCHIGGLSIITRCLASRVPIDLVERFSPDVVLARVRAGGTMLSVVPTMLRDLLDHDRDRDLSRLRVVLVGGAALDDALLERARDAGVPVLTTYGLTEACSQVTAQSPLDPPSQRAGSGRALDGVEVRVLRADGTDAAPGEVGEIHVSGEILMRGYRGQPRRVGPLATGDLGSLDARGNLHVAVRRFDLVVTGGENVYPAEVEGALRALPWVRDALVVGVPDERWGQSVAAIFTGTSDVSPLATRDALRATLASFKVPKRLLRVDSLPTLPSGKPDRRRAAEVLSATASLPPERPR